MEIVKMLLQNDAVAAMLIAVVAWLLKKLVEYMVVKWPALRKLKLNQKLEWVIHQVEEWKKRTEHETGKKPQLKEIDHKVRELTDRVPDRNVTPEKVATRRREIKSGIGISAGLDSGGPSIGIDFRKSF
jgi:hypothetical protein